MLGDSSEKSKNPLKKAMRRRNAKAVAFSAPTYIEASDVEYSTDEEIDEGGFFIDDEERAAAAAAAAGGDTDDAHETQDEDIVVEPLRPKPKETEEPENVQESQGSEPLSPETQQSNEEFVDAEGNITYHFSSDYRGLADSLADGTVSRSRNGTVRNTDSFFKDDTAEPKKISLTPNLLRDENAASNEMMKEVSICSQLR